MDALKTVGLSGHLGAFYWLAFRSPSQSWLLYAVKDTDTGFGSDQNALQLRGDTLSEEWRDNLQCPGLHLCRCQCIIMSSHKGQFTVDRAHVTGQKSCLHADAGSI